MDAGKTLKVNTIWLMARCADAGDYSLELTLVPPSSAPQPLGTETFTLARVNQYGGLHFSQKDVTALPQPVQIVPTDPPVKWQLKMTSPGGSDGGNLQKDEVEDMLIILGYEWE